MTTKRSSTHLLFGLSIGALGGYALARRLLIPRPLKVLDTWQPLLAQEHGEIKAALAALYCRLDDLLYEELSPRIRWARTKTLARGDEVCDFCWYWE